MAWRSFKPPAAYRNQCRLRRMADRQRLDGVSQADGRAALNAALDAGITFIGGRRLWRRPLGKLSPMCSRTVAASARWSPPRPAGDSIRMWPMAIPRPISRSFHRPQPEEPQGRQSPRSRAVALPAHRGALSSRCLRRAERAAEGRQDSRLWRQRREGRGGAEGD